MRGKKKMKRWMWIFCLVITVSCFFQRPAEALPTTLVNMKQIGFKEIDVPDNIANDEFVTKSLYFTLKEGASKLKGLKVNYSGKVGTPDDCYVTATVEQYVLDKRWREPDVYLSNEIVSRREQKYRDKDGNEKTMTITDYSTKVSDIPGGYVFTAKVTATVRLIDAKTGEVLVLYNGVEYNDKQSDAFHKIVKDFYKKVEKEAKRAKKVFGKSLKQK